MTHAHPPSCSPSIQSRIVRLMCYADGYCLLVGEKKRTSRYISCGDHSGLALAMRPAERCWVAYTVIFRSSTAQRLHAGVDADTWPSIKRNAVHLRKAYTSSYCVERTMGTER